MMGPPDNNHVPLLFWSQSNVREGRGVLYQLSLLNIQISPVERKTLPLKMVSSEK